MCFIKTHLFSLIIKLAPPCPDAIIKLSEQSFGTPAGYGVLCHFYSAHRDPTVFQDAESFDHRRWRGANSADRGNVFAFGGGIHACVGQSLVWKVLLSVGRSMIKNLEWEFSAR